jgi:hypothetical protein
VTAAASDDAAAAVYIKKQLGAFNACCHAFIHDPALTELNPKEMGNAGERVLTISGPDLSGTPSKYIPLERR